MANGDQPIIWQLEEMLEFCRKYRHIFIFGTGHNQRMLAKYLGMCGEEYRISGYVVSDEHYEPEEGEQVLRLADLGTGNWAGEEIGFLLAVSDWHFNRVLKNIFACGFQLEQVYLLSEYNKRTIAYKMTPRPRERMWIEINLADHCNLNCQMCDHFAPLAKKTFLDLDVFQKDMERLAELSQGHIDILKLQGGEPLLHPRLLDFIRVTRSLFPKAVIFLFTDGMLLKKWEHDVSGNLWQVCHDCDVWIQFTIYPIPIRVEEIKALAKKYEVHLDCFSEVGDRRYGGVKRSVKHPFDLSGGQEPYQFISCYQFNESITLRDGKLYTCPMIPYIGHFNEYFGQKLEACGEDSIDIYKAESYEELAEFVTRRVPFCRYCDIKHRRAFDWKQSEHTLSEYVDEGGESDDL